MRSASPADRFGIMLSRRRRVETPEPPAFDRQGVSPDDLIDFTPELHEEALKLVSRYKIGPIFTPWRISLTNA